MKNTDCLTTGILKVTFSNHAGAANKNRVSFSQLKEDPNESNDSLSKDISDSSDRRDSNVIKTVPTTPRSMSSLDTPGT